MSCSSGASLALCRQSDLCATAIDDVHRIATEAAGYCYSSRILGADREFWIANWLIFTTPTTDFGSLLPSCRRWGTSPEWVISGHCRVDGLGASEFARDYLVVLRKFDENRSFYLRQYVKRVFGRCQVRQSVRPHADFEVVRTSAVS